MSEKITFRELIESIAEETDNSKRFTRDFIKDFVEVINDGLEQDGSVNIAGFGKFKLRYVDERDGYNPQTEEKMTIPAHNKVVFKPYKNLRELVNAPFAHIEPKLIEKKDDSAEEGSTDPQDKDQADFIPTGPPTSTEETESDANSEEVAPFDLDEKDESPSSGTPFEDDINEEDDINGIEEDGDIVEFKADDADDEINKKLNELREKSDQSDSKEDTVDENAAVEKTLHQTEELFDDEKNEDPVSSISSRRSPREKQSGFPTVIVAAAFILLLAAGSVWYFGLLPEESQPKIISQTISGTDNLPANDVQQNVPSADNQQETQNDLSADNQDPQQTAGQNQAQNANSSGSATSAAKENEGIEIQKGQTLWSLAEEKYGNPRLWPWIYGTNESVQNPDHILAGRSLSVPLPSGPGNRLNSVDSVGVARGYIATYRWYKDNNSDKAKNHLLGATKYHNDIHNIADAKIDKTDLSYANRSR